jgi:hypothetical protein
VKTAGESAATVMSATIEALVNLLAATVRGWRGTAAFAASDRRPETLLELYDIEASPYRRLVREVLTELDLDVLVLPCPVGARASARTRRRSAASSSSRCSSTVTTARSRRRYTQSLECRTTTSPAATPAPRGDREAPSRP